MSRIEQAICSDTARGYEEQRLVRLFKSAHAKYEQCLFDVETEECDDPSACRRETMSWIVAAKRRKPPGVREEKAVIGDGEFFPLIHVAVDSDRDRIEEEELLSSPLAEYKLHLSRKSQPGRHAMARADRSVGECGCAYEACLDEAVLLGHCVRVTETAGAKRNFDVSACLTCFYRSVHPCVPDMKVGDIVLDYEFVVHGRGRLHPVYALLSHLAQSCRVNCLPSYRLIILSRHRGASVWTRGTDETNSRMLRANTVGAFLCAQDHRLATLLARCCNPTPLLCSEFYNGCGLLPRGDEEELLRAAYSRTLGPVFEFEQVDAFPGKVTTSLGAWRFLRLTTTSSDVKRFPGITVVDGHTVAFASESPLFYLKGEGPLVQHLESVAVIVDSSSQYRTDVLRNETPDWPDPTVIQDPIRRRPKHAVLDEMFMRNGYRDPLEVSSVERRAWSSLVCAQWTFVKRRDRGGVERDWENEYPVSQSLVSVGPKDSGVAAIRWLCGAPPERFCNGVAALQSEGSALDRIELHSEMARLKDPLVWRGFDILCSRVMACPAEKLWSTGLCTVSNHALDAFDERSTVPAAHLVTIVHSNEWYARPLGTGDTAVESSLLFSDAQVCSAAEFVHALARVMLSGTVHEELEIRCFRQGVYAYIQRSVAWFARAAGPFRSRNVTVFTPEAERDTKPWTHTLPAAVDVLKSSRSSYIVSCKSQCAERSDVKAMLANGVATERVNSFGNLVLHADRKSVQLSRQQREAGLHVAVETLYCDNASHGAETGDDLDRVYIYCDRSLKRFCEFHNVPKGIRGPELWARPIPWSKTNPSAFCFKVSQLKYRWESGLDEPTQVPVRDAGAVHSQYETQIHRWQRCASDGMLVPKKARFWYSVDHKRSFARTTERSSVSEGESCESEDSDGRPRADPRPEDSDSVTLGCEWYDEAAAGVLVLNSHIAIEFTYATPATEGHVFFDPVHNKDYAGVVHLQEDGKLIKFYKPYNYRSLTCDLYTVLMYGCGLTPVFAKESGIAHSDAAADNVLNLALCAVAVSHHITPMARTPCRTVAVVTPGGREQALAIARDINRVVVVTTPRIKQRGIIAAYSFKRLPETLETEFRNVALPSRAITARFSNCPCPTDFLCRVGVSLYSKLMQHWPHLAKRGDVKHPTSSRDPRWMGLSLCLAEWERKLSIADKLAPGAIECALRTLRRPR